MRDKRIKKTFKKNQNYSRLPLTNDDNYIIMANMTNNNKQRFERFNTMKEIIFQIIAPLWAVAVALIPAVLMCIL
tara:strand:+ start:2527 stop:2751 length:225 start_codon:yes stop_codon:yes gene_type:complete